ncbi:MAG: tetratricopeptide repeat protein, partial [Spirochaetota bacterium]
MLNIFTFLFAITFLMGVLYLRYLFMIYSIPRRIEEARRLFDTDEKKAVAICNSILALDKGNPLANWLMAKFHTKYKRYILALMFLNEIIQYAKFSPEVPEQDVRETVTQLYLYLGNIEKAIAQFNILQGRYHVNTSLIKRMVSILLEMGNTVEARHLVEKALESNPGDGELDYIFATILFKLNDHGKAESRCAAALRKGYVTPDLYFLLGKLQYLGHRYGEAVGNLSRAYDEKMEDEAECTNLLVQSYYNIHNYRAAVDLAEDKVENYPPADPNTAGIRFFLGCSHEKKGEIDAALAHWEKIKPSQNHYDAAKQKIEFFNYIAQKPYE